VGKNCVLGPDRAVIGDHERRVERGVETLHHVERLVPARQVGRVVVHLARPQVVHRAMRVVDQNVAAPRLHRAVDRGVHLVGEQLPADLVLGP
jgi:hypothetical protein